MCRNTQRVSGLCVVLFGVSLVASGSAISQSLTLDFALNPKGYRITPAPESRTAFLASANAFVWVDSDRLLFLAPDRDLSTTERRNGRTITTKAVRTIHLWDIKAGAIRRYRSDPNASYFCGRDGNLWYTLDRKGQRVVFEGRLGSEKERPETPPRLAANGNAVQPGFNRFDCSEYWHDEVPRPHGGRATLLRREHGALETMGADQDGRPHWDGRRPPFKAWQLVDGTSKEIEWPQEELTYPFLYSSILDGYLLTQLAGKVFPGQTNRIVLWQPKTNVVRLLDIPGSQSWTQLFYVGFTKNGLVARSNMPVADPRAKWNAGPAGIYYFTGSAIDRFMKGKSAAPPPGQSDIVAERINSGLIDERSPVSPDGCRVAVVIDPYDREDRNIRLELIDFCLTDNPKADRSDLLLHR